MRRSEKWGRLLEKGERKEANGMREASCGSTLALF